MNNDSKRPLQKPRWLKVRAFQGISFDEINKLLKENGINTVCREANCPNRGECYNRGTATFMILGSICSRNCRFCNVSPGTPEVVDPDEPKRLAETAAKMNLKYVVVTSVTRDDLPDGGADQFVQVIHQLRDKLPLAKIEILTPDFKNKGNVIDKIIEASPDVFNHNLETVRELYPKVRPQADYYGSLKLLEYVATHSEIIVKSGIMVGVGETIEQLEQLFHDLVEHRVTDLTIGQYLSPSQKHLAVEKYYSPEEFEMLKRIAESAGLQNVMSGPLVRSSYMAESLRI